MAWWMWGLGEEAFGIGEQCHLTLARARRLIAG